MKTRWLAMGMAVAVMVSGLTSVGTPRAAAEEPPLGWDESTDIYGLIFPVEKDYRYGDTYGACRSGCSRRHEGIDIKAPKMTKVFAAASGTVGWMHNDQGGKCCAMALYHDDGWETWYIHLNNDTPGTNDGKGWGFAPGIWSGVHVDAGDLIAYVGDSGNAEGTISHLHFELMRPGRNKINPYPHLKAAEPAPDPDPEPEPAADPGEVVYVGTRVDDGPTHDGTGNDSKGNNDGAAQCGETIELYVTVGNEGASTLGGLSAKLTESDPYLSILYNTSASYPSIGVGKQAENPKDWDLRVSGNAPAGHKATLTFTYTANNGGPWKITVELPVGCGDEPTPEPAPTPDPEPEPDGGGDGPLRVVRLRVDDDNRYDSRGNNDGAAQCGETIELWVTARNVGTKLLNGVTARLSESDPYLSILYNADSAYPDIPADRSRESARDWELAVSDKAPDGHRAMLKLTFNADGGGPWEVSVELPLGCG